MRYHETPWDTMRHQRAQWSTPWITMKHHETPRDTRGHSEAHHESPWNTMRHQETPLDGLPQYDKSSRGHNATPRDTIGRFITKSCIHFWNETYLPQPHLCGILYWTNVLLMKAVNALVIVVIWMVGHKHFSCCDNCCNSVLEKQAGDVAQW